MRRMRVLLVLSLVAAACGDNRTPEGPVKGSPVASSAVGGSQIAHSKSFMLVTNVSSVNQQTSKNRTNTLKSGLGVQ